MKVGFIVIGFRQKLALHKQFLTAQQFRRAAVIHAFQFEDEPLLPVAPCGNLDRARPGAACLEEQGLFKKKGGLRVILRADFPPDAVWSPQATQNNKL